MKNEERRMKNFVKHNMKKILIPIAVWLMACAPVMSQTSYLEHVKVDGRTVEKAGKEVRVSVDIHLDGVDMKKQHALQLVPVLVAADGAQQLALPPVEVYGKIRHKVVERQSALNGKSEADGSTTCVRRRNGTPQAVHYEASAPFRRWMVDGRLELRADITGCAGCGEGHEAVSMGTVLPYVEPRYALSTFVQPQEEEVKQRSEVRTARLQYRQADHRVMPAYRDNRAELDKVQASLDAVKENSNLDITGIYVTGYASPEGSATYNLALSERRAKGFTAYVQQHNRELDKNLWHVDWKGEDWAGLRREVEAHPGLLKRDEVLRIIDECAGSPDACEARLKALQPADIYQRLLNEMYVPLRRNEYRIAYTVRHFTLDEAKALLKTRPDLLSVAEIQRVADSYGCGTPEYIAALQVAIETYPDNVAARNNCALALVAAEDYDAAIALLKGHVESDGSLLNLLGVAYAKTGRQAEAKEAFAKAVQAGYAPAEDNLRQLEAALALLEE